MDDRERQELQELAETGRKAKVVADFIKEYLLNERVRVINSLETAAYTKSDELLEPVLYLRLLRRFENVIKTCIDKGDIAEKELMNDASE